MAARSCAALLTYVTLALAIGACTAMNMPSSGSFNGDGTYSPGATNGWACEGRQKPHPGLPHVAINAAQFGMGAACGACIEVTGTGKGAGKTPFEKKQYRVTVTNILTSGQTGDLDFPEDGDGRWGIEWSFIVCPGATSSSRKMLSEGSEEGSTSEYLTSRKMLELPAMHVM